MNEPNDHAAVIHVWHLDVLDDLTEALACLDERVHHFVTMPRLFSEEQRDRVKAAFPKAMIVCQRQRKSEPKGRAKCCHFRVGEIADERARASGQPRLS